ncbi:MAG: FAD-dependent oxidoreductase [Burkholderiales bacterium]|nr:MAG: FAD-dependent oxidoreductase [Burkholderiales bacterium]
MANPDTPNGRLFFQTEVFRSDRPASKRQPPGETVTEPARETPVLRHCDVLVVGGGPAGTTAAIAAARLGADVMLAERYNHLGGLATGGLVIWLDRMTDWDGQRVIRGLAEEIIDRIPAAELAGPQPAEWGSKDPGRAAYWAQRTAAFHGVVTHSPTLNPEWLKWVSQDMLRAAGVTLLLHAWASMPIVAEGAVRGAIFESKEGRFAVRARVVVDTTGDGDLFARAGAGFEDDIAEDDIHHCMNTAWLFGGVDLERWIAFRQGQPEAFAAFMQAGRDRMGLFERPFVSWRKDIALFMGPRQSGLSALDLEHQTFVEQRSRDLMVEHLAFYREHAPGFEQAYLLESAPQLGVRHTRRLLGTGAVRREQWASGLPLEDEIGVSPSLAPKFPNVSVSYGALVPARLDGLLAAGRHLSCDPSSHSFMREIPQCWLTGQAAGVAAALAADRGIEPRAVPVREVQARLVRQGAYVRCREPVDSPQPVPGR